MSDILTAKPELKTTEKIAVAALPEKPKQPIGPKETSLVKMIDEFGGPQTPTPDKTIKAVAAYPNLPEVGGIEIPEDRLATENILLNASRKAYIEAGYGIKSMLTNTEQQKNAKKHIRKLSMKWLI